MNKKLISAGKKLAAALFWAAVWQITAKFVGNPLLLPGPVQVLGRLGEMALQGEFWRITAFSIGRIVLGAGVAVVLGVGLAVPSAMSGALCALISPLMTAMKAAPVASFAILVLIWLERDLVPVVICGMMVLPVVWGNVYAGIREVDSHLLEMAKVYRLPGRRVLTQIYVPSVLPYFRAACRTALGLGWKAGIAAEVLTVPRSSIGRMIADSKLYLMTEDLFAWTLTVVVLSLLLEKITLRLLGGEDDRA